MASNSSLLCSWQRPRPLSLLLLAVALVPHGAAAATASVAAVAARAQRRPQAALAPANAQAAANTTQATAPANAQVLAHAGAAQKLVAARANASAAQVAATATPRRRSGNRVSDVVAMMYYINIDTASSRRTWMEEQLNKVFHATQIRHQRFSAITRENSWVQGVMKRKDFQTSVLYKEKETDVTSATLACYASHLGLLRLIRNATAARAAGGGSQQAQWALILEDDAIIDVSSLQGLPQFVKRVPDDAEVIKLGMWGNSRDEDEVSPGIYRVSPPSTAKSENGKKIFFYMGAHGYLVRLGKMQSLVKNFEGCALNNNYWADACLMYGPTSYQIKPSMVELEEFGSQIDASGDSF